jgi:O-antigen/teichoic acid export membrane protein
MKKQIKLSALSSYFIILVIGAAFVPLFALLAAFIVSRLRDPSGAIGAAALASLLLSAFAGGYISPRMRTDGWVSVTISSAVTLGALLCVLTLLLSDGESVGRGMLSALSYVGIFMLSAALSARPRKRKKRRR